MKNKKGSLGVARGWLFTPLVTTLILAFVFGLPGCGDQPLNVEPSQDEIGFFDLPFDDEAIAKRTVSYEAIYMCFQELSPEEGGRIEVPGSKGAFAFEVAPHSFPEETVFEIKVYIVDTDDALTVIYEFEPDGLVFSEPAKLIINTEVITGFAAESLDYYYLNGNKWIYQGTFSATDGAADEIVIDVPHFSKWGSEGGGKG